LNDNPDLFDELELKIKESLSATKEDKKASKAVKKLTSEPSK
jgi:hypothetical protein